jgi:hypothetical protein
MGNKYKYGYRNGISFGRKKIKIIQGEIIMLIKELFEIKKYKRKVESFAMDLLLFDIEKERRRHTLHYLKYDYRIIQKINGEERETILLGLEIAVSPIHNEIEYINFYVGKKINRKSHNYSINYLEYPIKLIDEIFESTQEATYYNDVAFETYLNNNILYFIDGRAIKNLIAYKINEDNYILMDENNKISGMVLKNFTEKELEVIYSTELI